MSKKTVTVICNLPKGSGITLRAPPANLAMDDPHHSPAEDLDLRHGINTGISAAVVDAWAKRLKGHVQFRKAGDHVILTADDEDLTTHVDDPKPEPTPTAGAGYWTPARIQFERDSIQREREAIARAKARIAADKARNARDRAASTTRAADARTVKTVRRALTQALATIDSIFHK